MNLKKLSLSVLVLLLPSCIKQKISVKDSPKIERQVERLEKMYQQELAMLELNDIDFEIQFLDLIHSKPCLYSENFKLLVYESKLCRDIKDLIYWSQCVCLADVAQHSGDLASKLSCIKNKLVGLEDYKDEKSNSYKGVAKTVAKTVACGAGIGIAIIIALPLIAFGSAAGLVFGFLR